MTSGKIPERRAGEGFSQLVCSCLSVRWIVVIGGHAPAGPVRSQGWFSLSPVVHHASFRPTTSSIFDDANQGAKSSSAVGLAVVLEAVRTAFNVFGTSRFFWYVTQV